MPKQNHSNRKLKHEISDLKNQVNRINSRLSYLYKNRTNNQGLYTNHSNMKEKNLWRNSDTYTYESEYNSRYRGQEKMGLPPNNVVYTISYILLAIPGVMMLLNINQFNILPKTIILICIVLSVFILIYYQLHENRKWEKELIDEYIPINIMYVLPMIPPCITILISTSNIITNLGIPLMSIFLLLIAGSVQCVSDRHNAREDVSNEHRIDFIATCLENEIRKLNQHIDK